MLTKEQIEQLTAVTEKLCVMYAEDEDIVRTIVHNKLVKLFKKVILAEDGLDALNKYRQGGIDLILTDNLMPNMTGLEFIEEVRKSDIKIPIILITAHMDTAFLIQAINLGVTQFIAKPISYDNLIQAIEIAVQRVIIENLASKAKEQELELLRYREKYHSLQQEMAFKKEINIIRNDLFLKKVDLPSQANNTCEWFIDLHYSPLDIMSGDSYSIREITPQNYLLFLIDAMGKGLSASVTTILSTSFVNHLIDIASKNNSFDFKQFIADYMDFIKKELLTDEIVCASFILIDFVTETLTTALFSMPPILMQSKNGDITSIKANNLPIMKYLKDFVTDTFSLKDIVKILIYSDGLSESINSQSNTMYEQFIKEDFAEAYNKKEFANLFYSKIGKPDDDVTFMFIKRLSCMSNDAIHYCIPSKYEDITKVTYQIEQLLYKHGMLTVDAVTFINSITEMLMNAHEHGNLNIDYGKKHALLSDDIYDLFLCQAEQKANKYIYITVDKQTYRDKSYLIVRIADEGSGFDTKILLDNYSDIKIFNGRGIKIAEQFTDEIYYNRQGSEVTLVKKI